MSDATAKPGRLAIVALGANLGDRERTLRAALERLAAELGPVEAVSRLHETAALIHPSDPTASYPAYLNGAALVRTGLAAEAVLDRLQATERALGRDRAAETARWRPRIVDLDLLALGDLVMASERLTLPHPEMHKRSFVLEPLAEIAPDWRHPILDATVAVLLERLRAAAG